MKLYVLIDPRDTMVRYVGITHVSLSTRLTQHISESKTVKRNHRRHWINSLVVSDLRPRILEIASFETKEEAIKAEIEMIGELKNEGWNLVNNTIGGESSRGHISPLRGVPRSESTKQKISQSQRGKKRNLISIEKMRQTKIGKPSKKRTAIIDQFGCVYTSLTQASQITGAHISNIHKVLKDEQHSTKGFIFSYLNNTIKE